MKKIISILMAFALVFNLFGKSFGNNQKLQKNVDETNIYESYLNKKTQKMNIKVTDALNKKLVYADSVDLSNVDEEKILKDIQENQEIEENLEIFETEDDELEDKQFYYYLERAKERLTNKTYKSWITGYSYRIKNRLGETYWTIGKRNDLFDRWNYFTVTEDDETNIYLLGYKSGVYNIRQVETNIVRVLGATSFYAIAQIMPKIGFWGIFNTGVVASFIGVAVIGSLVISAFKFLSDIEYHRYSVHFNYSALEEIYWKKYMEQIKPPQEVKPPQDIKPPYPTTPGIVYGGKGF